MVHWNCPVFGTKVNIDNTYEFAILKLFGKILFPSNPLNPFKNQTFKVRRDVSRDPALRACYMSTCAFFIFIPRKKSKEILILEKKSCFSCQICAKINISVTKSQFQENHEKYNKLIFGHKILLSGPPKREFKTVKRCQKLQF